MLAQSAATNPTAQGWKKNRYFCESGRPELAACRRGVWRGLPPGSRTRMVSSLERSVLGLHLHEPSPPLAPAPRQGGTNVGIWRPVLIPAVVAQAACCPLTSGRRASPGFSESRLGPASGLFPPRGVSATNVDGAGVLRRMPPREAEAQQRGVYVPPPQEEAEMAPPLPQSSSAPVSRRPEAAAALLPTCSPMRPVPAQERGFQAAAHTPGQGGRERRGTSGKACPQFAAS